MKTSKGRLEVWYESCYCQLAILTKIQIQNGTGYRNPTENITFQYLKVFEKFENIWLNKIVKNWIELSDQSIGIMNHTRHLISTFNTKQFSIHGPTHT